MEQKTEAECERLQTKLKAAERAATRALTQIDNLLHLIIEDGEPSVEHRVIEAAKIVAYVWQHISTDRNDLINPMESLIAVLEYLERGKA